MLTLEPEGTWTWTARDQSVFYHELHPDQVTIIGTEPDNCVAFCGSVGDSNALAQFIVNEIGMCDGSGTAVDLKGTVNVGQYRNGLIGAFDKAVYTELVLIIDEWRAKATG